MRFSTRKLNETVSKTAKSEGRRPKEGLNPKPKLGNRAARRFANLPCAAVYSSSRVFPSGEGILAWELKAREVGAVVSKIATDGKAKSRDAVHLVKLVQFWSSYHGAPT